MFLSDFNSYWCCNCLMCLRFNTPLWLGITSILLWLFWQMSMWYDLRLLGIILFSFLSFVLLMWYFHHNFTTVCSLTTFHFQYFSRCTIWITEKTTKITITWLTFVGVWTHKREPVHLCNTTVVHYNVASSHSLRNRCLSNRDIALKITVQLLINKNAESNKCCVYNVPKICINKDF